MRIRDRTSRDGVSATLNTQTPCGPLDHGQGGVQPSGDSDGATEARQPLDINE
jgi:hypothetical protein